jgi:hypothetical protein
MISVSRYNPKLVISQNCKDNYRTVLSVGSYHAVYDTNVRLPMASSSPVCTLYILNLEAHLICGTNSCVICVGRLTGQAFSDSITMINSFSAMGPNDMHEDEPRIHLWKTV